MAFTVRPAVASDHGFLAEWTEQTFDWGDYVAGRFLEWLDDDDTMVFVAEADGQPIALGRVALASPAEAWSSAMRVHPDHRRSGVGSAVGAAMWRWASASGARIIRLAVEDWNEPAQRQVRKAGFRPLCDWLRAVRDVGAASPVPEGNGGIRFKGAEALRPAHAAEAEPALLSWTGGELARGARGLFPTGWTWRRLTRHDLEAAARGRTFWEGRPGWALGRRTEDRFLVDWVETNPADARAMVRALVETAADSGADQMRAWIPRVDWLARAFRSAGFDTSGLIVYGMDL